MNSDRWRRVEEVYDAVLTLPPERRAAVLEELCAADAELRREVESLLAARDRAGDFLSPGNLLGHIASVTADGGLPEIGSRLGDYEIRASIGAGAMGEVYRARDTRLDRDVALKVLPSHVVHDSGRIARFRLEAKAASALNHPNIVTIYEIGRAGGTWYIAAELVEGVTLRERISAGRLGPEEAVGICLQCAAAGGAAHRAGVVHRDIKPENIMVRFDGVVKIVDFGLARVVEARPEWSLDVTQTGTVVGTPRYMSPEQARGEKPDTRSDVFSLGAVLFELITGRPAFPGKTTAEVFSALLNQEPDMAGAGPLGGVISRAIAKDPAARYQSMDEFANVLRSFGPDEAAPQRARRQAAPGIPPVQPRAHSPWDLVGQRLRPVAGGASRQERRNWRYPAIAAAIVLAVVAAVYGLRLKTGTLSAGVQLRPPIPLTGMDGLELWPVFSPDGKQVVYARDAGDGKPDLYLKLIDGGPPLRLPATESGNLDPAWSPDGLQIAFRREYPDHVGVFIMGALGGAERLVGSVSEPVRTERGLAWRPDGKALIVSDRARAGTSALWSLPLDGSARQRLTSPPDDCVDIAPAFSRDGKTLAFIRSTGAGGELFVLQTPGQERRISTGGNMDSLAWSAGGESIFFTTRDVHDRAIFRIRPGGRDAVRLSGIAAASPFNIAVAGQGDRLAFAQKIPGTSQILKLDNTGQKGPQKLIASAGFDTDPSFSPDGTRIAFASTRSGKSQIWVSARDGGNPVPVTSYDGPQSGSPRWSPDSKQIAFDHDLKVSSGVFVMNADGGGLRELASNAALPEWSPDGRWIYFRFRPNRSESWQIWKTPPSGGAPVQVTQNGGFECFPPPDGRFLYYTKDRERAGIWRMPVDGGQETEIPELRPVLRYRYWSGTSAGIYFFDPGSGARSAALKFFRFANRRVQHVLSPVPPPMSYVRGLAVSSDGRQVLWVEPSRQISQILLVEGFR
jgi:Tol biopolymer transport system component